eukprot:scaffold57852_cov63-Phaeocystis_antarctica.AAC.6
MAPAWAAGRLTDRQSARCVIWRRWLPPCPCSSASCSTPGSVVCTCVEAANVCDGCCACFPFLCDSLSLSAPSRLGVLCSLGVGVCACVEPPNGRIDDAYSRGEERTSHRAPSFVIPPLAPRVLP